LGTRRYSSASTASTSPKRSSSQSTMPVCNPIALIRRLVALCADVEPQRRLAKEEQRRPVDQRGETGPNRVENQDVIRQPAQPADEPAQSKGSDLSDPRAAPDDRHDARVLIDKWFRLSIQHQAVDGFRNVLAFLNRRPGQHRQTCMRGQVADDEYIRE